MPQRHVCIAYDLVLGDSSDETLYAMACEKAEMMTALSGRTGQDIMQNLSCIEDAHDSDEGADEISINHDKSERDLFISHSRAKYRKAATKAIKASSGTAGATGPLERIESYRADTRMGHQAHEMSTDPNDSFGDLDDVLQLGLDALESGSVDLCWELDNISGIQDENDIDLLLKLGLEQLENDMHVDLPEFETPRFTEVIDGDTWNEHFEREHSVPAVESEERMTPDNDSIAKTFGFPDDFSHSTPSSDKNYALPSSLFDLEDREESAMSKTWNSSHVRPSKRPIGQQDIEDAPFSKRGFNHSAWGVRLNRIRAGATPLTPLSSGAIGSGQCMLTTRLDRKQRRDKLKAAGGTSSYLSQLSAQLDAEHRTENGEHGAAESEQSNSQHAQRSSQYTFNTSSQFRF